MQKTVDFRNVLSLCGNVIPIKSQKCKYHGRKKCVYVFFLRGMEGGRRYFLVFTGFMDKEGIIQIS